MGLYDPPSANNSTKNRFDMDFPRWNVNPQKGTGAWKGTYGFEIPGGLGPYDSSYPTMWVQGPEDMNPSKAAYLRRVMDIFRLGELKQGYGERQRMMEGLDAGELAANGSLTQWFGPQGIDVATNGLSIERVAGTFDCTLFYMTTHPGA